MNKLYSKEEIYTIRLINDLRLSFAVLFQRDQDIGVKTTIMGHYTQLRKLDRALSKEWKFYIEIIVLIQVKWRDIIHIGHAVSLHADQILVNIDLRIAGQFHFIKFAVKILLFKYSYR